MNITKVKVSNPQGVQDDCGYINNEGDFYIILNNVCEIGQKYVLSFYVKTTASETITFGEKTYSTKANIWERVVFELEATAKTLKLNFSGGEWWLHKWKLEIGNKCTDWTPSAEDVDSQIETVKNVAGIAQSTADKAFTIANGKNKNYYQSSMPSGTSYTTGDNWFDIKNGYALYQWNGKEWIKSEFGSDAIAASAINAGKIATGAITADKLAADAVIAGKIAANAITTYTIATGAITTDKLSAEAVTAEKIASRTITAEKILAKSITATEIAASTITASELSSGAVTADKLAANAVTAAKIASGAITTDKLAANAITADKIASKSITADKLNVTDLSALNATIANWQIGQTAITKTLNTFIPPTSTEIEEIRQYMLGNASLSSDEREKYDFNCNNKIDAYDLIYARRQQLGISDVNELISLGYEPQYTPLTVSVDYSDVRKIIRTVGKNSWGTEIDNYFGVLGLKCNNVVAENIRIGTSILSSIEIVDSYLEDDSGYIKFYDGTLICTQRIVFNDLDISTEWGSMYESAELDLGQYKETFIEVPKVTLSIGAGSNAGAFIEGLWNAGTSSVGKTCLCRPTSYSSGTYVIQVLAIGKWKD